MAADQETALTSIEVLPKSAYWQVVPGLQAPLAERGQVYVVEDIDDGQTQAYLTDPEYSVFYARLGEERLPGEVRWVAIADNVIMEVARDRTLAGVWLLDLPPEIALARRQARTTSGANGPARPM
jgi:hypothetical protein